MVNRNKQLVLSDQVLRSGSRLRLRARALLHGALTRQQVTKTELARRLGIGKSAVNAVLNGDGDLRLQTLSEYLGVLGYELELVPTEMGDIRKSMIERRAPAVSELTIRDADLKNLGSVISARPSVVRSNNRLQNRTRVAAVVGSPFLHTASDAVWNGHETKVTIARKNF